MRKRRAAGWVVSAATAAAAMVVGPSPLFAVSWNATNSGDSAITTVPLTDQPTLFLNENVVNDTANSTRGTGTYLGNGWVLTAQHVITGSANIYGTDANPNQITMTVNIGGANQNYTADTLVVNGSADIALIHLAGTNSGPIAAEPGVLASAIYSGSSESGNLVQLGGYGYYGPLAGTLSMDASFHRAFNVVASVSSPFLNVAANGSSVLVNNNYVMGIGESGDSGSGLWLNTSGNVADTNLWDYSLAGELNTTSNTNNFGSNNQYERTSNNASWILSNAFAARGTVTWDLNSATAGIQEGSGTWDLSTANFGNGAANSNVAWDNGTTTTNADFGAHKGAAGVVTLGANISVQNLQFNPALSGNYTIAGSGSFTLSLSSTSILSANAGAVATISAPLVGGGGTILKLGTGTIVLSGVNTFTGTLQVGDNATSGGNVNGAICIASSSALNGLTTLNLQDNNGAYSLLQFDGTGGNVTIGHPAFSWSGNTAGPAGTAATIFESIGGANSYTGAITGNSGGIGYGIAVDAGSMTFNTFTTTTSKTLYLRGAGNGSFTGVVSGANVGINVTDSGTWTLNNSNTYGLATTLAGGVLSTSRLALGGSASGIGNSSNVAGNLVFNGGELSYTGAIVSTDRLFTIGPAGGTLDASGSGAVTFLNGGSAVSSDAATHASTTVAASNVVTITAGGMSDLAVGMGVSGTGIIPGSTIFSINPDAGTITLNQNALSSNTGDTLTFGIVGRSLTLSGSNLGNNTLSPKLSNSAGGGVLGVTKVGGGLWILNAVENYTGATAVDGGTLTLSSSASLASTADSVSGGAIFNVNGSLNSATNLADDGTANLNAASETIASLSGGGTVNLNADTLSVGNGGSFSGAIAGTGSLNLTGGTFTLAATGSMRSAHVTVGSGATLNANGAVGASTALTANGAVQFGANTGLTGPAARTLASLSFGANGNVKVNSSLSPSNRTVLVTDSLTFAGTKTSPLGTLDLVDNDMIVGSSDEGTVYDLLFSGYNAGSGYWNGSGIDSSAAAGDASHLTTLGYESGQSSFDNQPTDPSDILIKYTYYGDADLDGSVTFADYDLLETGFADHLTGWSNGDFNYDGVVDAADFALFDSTFLALNGFAVPEPASFGFLVIGTIGLFARRRCRLSDCK